MFREGRTEGLILTKSNNDTKIVESRQTVRKLRKLYRDCCAVTVKSHIVRQFLTGTWSLSIFNCLFDLLTFFCFFLIPDVSSITSWNPIRQLRLKNFIFFWNLGPARSISYLSIRYTYIDLLSSDPRTVCSAEKFL